MHKTCVRPQVHSSPPPPPNPPSLPPATYLPQKHHQNLIYTTRRMEC